MSAIEEAVCQKILARAELGFRKYGITLADPLNIHTKELAVLRHAQEEAMDLCNYLEVRIQQLENTPGVNPTLEFVEKANIFTEKYK